MSISYSLYENRLKSTDIFYAAIVESAGTIGLNELAEEIVNMGTTVRKADVIAVLENACQAIENNLLKGYRVSVGGVVDVYTSIKGRFTDGGDTFDPARHEFDVCANAGSRVRKAVRASASAEKVIPVPRAPYLVNYIDMGSSTTNQEITPGSIGTIIGSKLNFDQTNSSEGIFFVGADASETRVTGIERNKPSELVFMVPTLTTQDYHLEVRSVRTKEGSLRIGILPHTLTYGPVVAKSNGGNGSSKRAASRSSSRSNGTKKRRALAKA